MITGRLDAAISATAPARVSAGGSISSWGSLPWGWTGSALAGAEGHHYNHNAETYMLVGDALGRAMVDLLDGTTNPADYTTWAAQYAPADLGDPDADLDGDGLSLEASGHLAASHARS